MAEIGTTGPRAQERLSSVETGLDEPNRRAED